MQSTLAALLEAGHGERGLNLESIVRMTSRSPAARFRIAGKGLLAAGYDADLVLVDPVASFTLAPQDLHQRHALSPYIGSRLRGRVERTILRGQTIFHGGRITATANGKWVRPSLKESPCFS